MVNQSGPLSSWGLWPHHARAVLCVPSPGMPGRLSLPQGEELRTYVLGPCVSRSVGYIPRCGIPGIKGRVFLTWPALARSWVKCQGLACRRGSGADADGEGDGSQRRDVQESCDGEAREAVGAQGRHGTRPPSVGRPGGGLFTEHLLYVCCWAGPVWGALPRDLQHPSLSQ